MFQHHCYSSTKKLDWEKYTVEKGCKKIAYCKSDADTKPEWTRPWNFCCDKSRCNAKQGTVDWLCTYSWQRVMVWSWQRVVVWSWQRLAVYS